MRTLKFIVDVQHIYKDPNCDFSNIVAGTRNYLQAEFAFSPEWQNCIMAASFWRGGQEHAVLIKDGKCDIPPEVLGGRTFGLSILGRRDDYQITTNRVIVRQEVPR